MTTRFTIQALLDLVEGDREVIEHLVEEGIIEIGEDYRAVVDVDIVLVARTLWRELAIDWSGIGVILRLTSDLARARQRIAELEALVAKP